MPLPPGTRLGPYEVVAPLGSGGMGEVYRARDTGLQRQVAIKVLPDSFARDGEEVARLRREAQLLASLNHPNVAAIYGLEAAGDIVALVLELVEGDDLAQRLARGALPVDDTVACARQLVDALEAAHEKGIVHRDLKPGNIKITPDGVVKVLDFGLAKAYGDDAPLGSGGLSQSPTFARAATEAGVILGTAAYMSPEQARGKAVDKRTDIWAFGVVLFEMLTASSPFTGETLSDTLAAVLTREPDMARLPASTPPGVRRLIARCLERDPKKRLRDIGDARPDLDDVSAAPAVRPVALSRWRALPWVVAVVAVLVSAWALWARAPQEAGAPAVLHLNVTLPSHIEPVLSLSNGALAISPNGRSLVMVGASAGVRRLYLRQFDRPDTTEVPGSVGSNGAVFSPDSTSLAFLRSNGTIVRLSLVNFEQKILTAGVDLGSELAWSAAGVVFNRDGALWVVSPEGGEARAITTLDAGRGELLHDQPVVLPGDRVVLFAGHTTDAADERIEAVPFGGGPRTVIVERAIAPVWSETGHLLFARGGAVLASPFDPDAPARVDQAVPVIAPGVIATLGSGNPGFRLSSAGTLLYMPAGFGANRLVSVGRDGAALALDVPPGEYVAPRVSPDGRRVLFGQGMSLVEGVDLARGTRLRLTAEYRGTGFASWLPDGRQMVFRRFHLPFWAPADGSGAATPVPSTGINDFPAAPGPEPGSFLALRVNPATASDVFLMSVDGAFEPRPLVVTQGYDGGPQLSPDGQWLLYQSDVSGQPEIYVRRYPVLDRQWQVSAGGGVQPRWSRTSREVFYRSGGHVIAVAMDASGAEPAFATPVPLFADEYEFGRGITLANYDATADGRLLMLRREPGSGALHAVVNWTTELKRILADGGVR
jgi:eukaryotic-like serine/threonine-protein kinase